MKNNMKKIFLFCTIVMATLCICSCSKSDDDSTPGSTNQNNTPPPVAKVLDNNDKLLSELYLRTFGYLFSNGQVDTDIDRVLELQNQLVANNSNGTRGIVGGAASVVKFVNIIRMNQKSTTAKIVSVLLKQKWTPEKVFRNLKDRGDGTKYGYTDAQKFYNDLLSGRLNTYAGNIYNDLYNSGTEFSDETVHPMKMATMLAPELAACAKDIIFAAYPNDIISWGSVSNDLVNDIAEIIQKKGNDPKQIVSIAKDIITATAMSAQIGLDDDKKLDQDVFDLIVGESIDAIKEYIDSVEQPEEELQSAWGVIADWVYEEVPNDPNSEWHQFLGNTFWYVYDIDKYYQIYFSQNGKVSVNIYNEPYRDGKREGWLGMYEGVYTVSGDHIAIKTKMNNKFLAGVATMSGRVSGMRRHLILTRNDQSLTLHDVENDGWEPAKSPILPGTYERYSYNEETHEYTGVNELGMIFGKDNKFVFYTNTVYFNRFEGTYSYSEGSIIVKVNSFYSRTKGKTISVKSGTVSVPCSISGSILTIGNSSYQDVVGTDGETYGLKIISGTYRMQK